jgi:hypothetical protein|tara:strand:- start:3061 stop:3252 length:192 start_codon:yes stop_codon:yes gene_type:complete
VLGFSSKKGMKMSLEIKTNEDNPSDIEYLYEDDEEEMEMVIVFEPDPELLKEIIKDDKDETIH